MKRAVLVVLLPLVVACRKETRATLDASSTQASAAPTTSAPLTTGPASSSASRAARESAVADIILGGAAARLPERATDPSAAFDDNLRDKIAPRKLPPSTRTTKIEVSAGLPREVVERIIRTRFGQLRACYERRLEKKPELAGHVIFTFTIDRDGQVKGVKGVNAGELDIGDPELVRCIGDMFGALTFPQPERAPVQVTYGVALHPPD